MEWPKLIAGLTRMVRDVGVAEDLAQDALVAALQQWPDSGIPRNPGAWLMAAAKHRAVDYFRRNKLLERKHEELGYELGAEQDRTAADLDAALDDDVGDDLLRLVFISCHPVLSTEARVALTLRLLGGLTTDEIARAFLVSEPTIAQRIVRAKRTLAKERVPFEVPRGDELAARLSSVLKSESADLQRGLSRRRRTTGCGQRCDEATQLGRVLPSSRHRNPRFTVWSRSWDSGVAPPARVGPAEPSPAPRAESRALDRLIRRALAALERAEELGGSGGRFALQAAMAACHARALTPEDTDWAGIASLYALLGALTPSPVIELNRAVAVGMAYGPQQGLAVGDVLLDDPSLRGYHLLQSVRGDLLYKLGRFGEARAALERAAAITRNARERDMLLERARASAQVPR